MSWQHILQNDRPEGTLRQRIDALFAQQRENLAHAPRWRSITWQSTAKNTYVWPRLGDRASESRATSFDTRKNRCTIGRRAACFLCPENMPAEERGVAFEDLVVMPNPFPVLPMHCTIAAREHRPQLIAGRIDCALRLAAAIGPDLAAFYNGPRCGASAPDHFHFQAASASEIPILAQLPDESSRQNLAAPLDIRPPHADCSRHRHLRGSSCNRNLDRIAR